MQIDVTSRLTRLFSLFPSRQRLSKSFGAFLTCAGIIVCGLLWRSYIASDASGVLLKVPEFIELGEIVYEPTIGFEFPVTNQSSELLRVLSASDCNCIKLQNRLVELDVGKTTKIRGDILLSRLRTEKLGFRFTRDVVLDVDPFGTSLNVQLRGTVVEPLRLVLEDSIEMTIDPEDRASFSKSFQANIHDGCRLQKVNVPGMKAMWKSSSVNSDSQRGVPLEFTFQVDQLSQLQAKPVWSIETIFSCNGKSITQQIPAKILVLKPLRISTERKFLGLLSPGQHKLQLPFRFASGSDGRIIIEQVRMGEDVIVAHVSDASLEVQFSVLAGPPKNIDLHVPFSCPPLGNDREVFDEIVIPISYSCL